MTTYGLLGYPLAHSFSRHFFSEKFLKEGLDAEYLNFEMADISVLPDLIDSLPQLRGLNVTRPYKESVMAYLNDLSPEAKAIGAVNCIKISRKDGKPFLKGYNADVIGFSESLKPLLKKQHTKALILGTGGASKAIRYGLESLGIEWRLVSRTPDRLKLGYSNLTRDIMSEYLVVVNCSPLGTFPDNNTCPDIPYQFLTDQHLLYDLVYNPEKSLFLCKGEQQGSCIKNGLEMLHLQALASWKYWQEDD